MKELFVAQSFDFFGNFSPTRFNHVHGYFFYFARAQIVDNGNFFSFSISKKILPRKKHWTQIGEYMYYTCITLLINEGLFLDKMHQQSKNRGILFHGQFCILEGYNVSFSCALNRFSRAKIFENQQKVLLSHFFRVFSFFHECKNFDRAKFLFSRKITVHISN